MRITTLKELMKHAPGFIRYRKPREEKWRHGHLKPGIMRFADGAKGLAMYCEYSEKGPTISAILDRELTSGELIVESLAPYEVRGINFFPHHQ
jgi:hypothetical protein